jgi:AcrR family transcriptional regulator
MRRKTTQEILAESFRELSEQKPVDKITIREITDNCGYSPATFYRHFKDKYDMIAWDHTRSVAAIMSRIGDNFTWENTLLAGAQWF